MEKTRLLILLIFYSTLIYTQEEARLLRFPATNDSIIAFSYAGDLYQVSINGGMARKITSHVGYEMFPRFSPDGQHIAFTGQYDGNTEVYLVPKDGGQPKRLTYTATLRRDDISDRMGPNNIVMTWSPDGKNIIYRSRKQSYNPFKGKLYSVPLEGGLSTVIPLSEGGFCSYSPNGKKLAFNRVFREFRTWKYYRGGMADDIRIFDLEMKEIKNITNNDAQDIIPMWISNEIYYLSDRDRTMNLFVYNTKNEETTKVTDFTEYDIKFPSAGKQFIVFENGGYIYKFNTQTKSYDKISVQIGDDFQYARNEYKDASKKIRDMHLSPEGERALFSARGDIYTVPAKSGYTRNLTQSPGVHDREAVWSPNEEYIAYISDASGEFEIWMIRQDGSEPPVQLTKNTDSYIFNIKWSPDGKKIAWIDRKLRLQYIDIESKNITLVEQAQVARINHYNWSPDSKWLSYANRSENNISIIHLYNLTTKTTHKITDNWYNSSWPVFSDDGKYLFFISARHFNPVFSWTEWNHAYKDMDGIYLVTLAKETPSPFAPENDEVNQKKEEEEEKKEEHQKVTIVDIDGIKSRIIELPVKSSKYMYLAVANNKVYYTEKKIEGNITKVYDLKKKEEKEVGKKIRYVVSPGYSKMLIRQNSNYSIIDLPTGSVSITKAMDLSSMKVWVDYEQEWSQIFDESWRQMRDFFYTPNMHGVDWDAMHEKYEVLIPHVKHRNDLTYIIGEMIGELNTGHAYISAREKPQAKRINTGLLGAQLSRHTSGYYKIDKILEGANWSKNLRSPLQEVGVNINDGDFIIAINGKSTQNASDIYSLLIDQTDKPVELTISKVPSSENSNKYLVKPIADESALYYYSWVQNNIRIVSEATDNQVGYIHVPDMSPRGLNEFAKYFYPQINKKGLIIDDRGNGGGNVSPMIIERLGRELIRSHVVRDIPTPYSVPREVIRGPKVMLVDKYSASDGDLFPYAFKEQKLGTVIGERTWGGVVGIYRSLPFIDGTELRKPEVASYSATESKWIIEGHGVEPDIYISNDPYKEFLGEDAQLDKAIEVILGQLDEYKPIPEIPEAPDKSK